MKAQQLQRALELGDLKTMHMIALQMSGKTREKVLEYRWQQISDFLANNDDLPAEMKLEKMKLAKDRIQLETDVGILLGALSEVDRPEQLQLRSILRQLNGTYKANRLMNDFSAIFPEDSKTTFYKMVAVIGARFYSIYDGKTEYKLGHTLRCELSPSPLEKSGFFVCRTQEDALAVKFGRECALVGCPRALLRVRSPEEAPLRVWDSGASQALSVITPECVLVKFGLTPSAPAIEHTHLVLSLPPPETRDPVASPLKLTGPLSPSSTAHLALKGYPDESFAHEPRPDFDSHRMLRIARGEPLPAGDKVLQARLISSPERERGGPLHPTAQASYERDPRSIAQRTAPLRLVPHTFLTATPRSSAGAQAVIPRPMDDSSATHVSNQIRTREAEPYDTDPRCQHRHIKSST